MEERKFIVRGIIVTYFHYAASFTSILIVTPIILQHVGQSAYGIWAIFSSMVGYFMLCSFGINTAIAKYTAEYRALNDIERLNKLVSTSVAFLLFICFFMILLVLALLPFIPGIFHIHEDLISEAKIAFLIMGINSALMLLGGVAQNIIYGYQRVDIWKACSMIFVVLNACLTVLFLYLGFGLVGVATASIASTLVLISLYLIFLHFAGYGITVRTRLVDLKIFKEIAPYSIRTFILGGTSQLLYFTDYIVIGIFLGAISVTPYEIVYKLCFLVTYLFSAISTVFFPRFSSLHALGDLEKLRELYLWITKISVAIIMPLVLFLLFFGQSFINLWVGPENFAGMGVLIVLILMDILHAVGTPAGLLLQGIGKNRRFVYSELVNAGLNLIISIILIQKIGILGVALGTLIAHALTSTWFIPAIACKFVKLPVRKYILTSIIPPVLSGIVTGGVIWLFVDLMFSPDNFIHLIMNGLLILIFYAIVFLAIGVSTEDRSHLTRFLFSKRAV